MLACVTGNIDVVSNLLNEIISIESKRKFDIWFNVLEATEFTTLCNKVSSLLFVLRILFIDMRLRIAGRKYFYDFAS